MKKDVHLNEYNLLMDNSIYLPLVSGLLQSYSQNNPILKKEYQFMPFHFIREPSEQILSYYQNPSVAGFSVSMWNYNLNLEVARKVKEKFPECLTIFGGPHIPIEAKKFLREHPYIDITVRGDGEKTFSEILNRNLETKDFRGIEGISFITSDGDYVKTPERELIKDLDEFPSPYLNGIFDKIINTHNIDFQAIVETNRGCSFSCSYCSWNKGGLSKKFRFFSKERVTKLAKWCGEKKIKYVFCSDSNFGMFKRDIEIAKAFVDAKKEFGFPEKFRVCYGKNSENSIFQTGKLLAQNDIGKGVTLSIQSNNPETLKNIERKNIKQEVFNSLQKRYNQEGIPVYTELILGLPGETYQSFANGLEKVLQSGIENQLFVYPCQVYPNTKLANKDYQNKFGIKTINIPLAEVHVTERSKGLITEYEKIIIGTDSMPEKDWKKSMALSTTVQLFHGLKMGFHLINYLSKEHAIKSIDFFEFINKQKEGIIGQESQFALESATKVINGQTHRKILPEFSPIYWDPEEASFLEISKNKDKFFEELFELSLNFLSSRNKKFRREELEEIIKFQKLRIPDYKPLKEQEYYFKFNVPEYFNNFEENKKLKKIPKKVVLDKPRDFNGDKKAFAKEIILWGRKSEKILRPTKWWDV